VEVQRLSSERHFQAAGQVLEKEITRLQGCGYIRVPQVEDVLKDLGKVRELIENEKVWDNGGADHFAALSYSHLLLSRTSHSCRRLVQPCGCLIL